MARTFKRTPTPEDQRRARTRLVLYVVGGVVLAVLLGILALYLRVTGGPALPSEVRLRVREEERQAKVSGGEAARPPAAVPAGTPALRQQVEQLQQAGQTGDTTSHTLYITDSELNAELAGVVRDHQEVKEVKAYFGEGKAYLVTRLDVRGHELTVTLALRPVIANGGLQFEVESAHVGGMAAPERLVAEAREQLAKKGNLFTPEQTGLYVEKAELKPGVAILTGQPVARK